MEFNTLKAFARNNRLDGVYGDSQVIDPHGENTLSSGALAKEDSTTTVVSI